MATFSKGSVKIGWDDSEQKEFAKAIRANLLVQTPLQVRHGPAHTTATKPPGATINLAPCR